MHEYAVECGGAVWDVAVHVLMGGTYTSMYYP